MTNSNEELKEDGQERDHGHRHRGCCHGRGKFLAIPFIIAAVILIKSALVMFLWNGLIPDLFHGPVLTFLQAIGITVLAKLLTGFGGRHFGDHMRGHFGGPPRWALAHWAKARWAGLSPEEREKLREDIRKRCEE